MSPSQRLQTGVSRGLWFAAIALLAAGCGEPEGSSERHAARILPRAVAIPVGTSVRATAVANLPLGLQPYCRIDWHNPANGCVLVQDNGDHCADVELCAQRLGEGEVAVALRGDEFPVEYEEVIPVRVVETPATRMYIVPQSVTLAQGDEFWFNYVVVDTAAFPYLFPPTWTSSDTTVVRLRSGTAEARRPGQATIHATIDSISVSAQVTVVPYTWRWRAEP